MSLALEIFGALGGTVVFGGAVLTVVRGIFRLVSATEANTAALNRLTERYDNHETRISRLEGSRR